MDDLYSLREFIDERREQRGRVVIPVIQRDFAQGRDTPGARAVRTRFLASLRAAVDDTSENPLVLDFIYGAERPSAIPHQLEFLPLDGQQRLTTLWLLHWYLAQLEGRGEEFEDFAVPKESSGSAPDARFTYEVRPSSKEFFGELAGNQIELSDLAPSEEHPGPLARRIMEEPWFLLLWKSDPTVQAGLTMLDAIHWHFHDCKGGYDRLCDTENRAIVFHMLNLGEYGLSDELYIKMNARGRPLTEFEVFKAELEKVLEEALAGVTYEVIDSEGMRRTVSAHDYVRRRWDTVWSDLFWPFRGTVDSRSQTYDAEIMNLIRSTSMATLPWFSTEPAEKIEKTLRQLRDGEFIRFSDYNEHGCMSAGYLRHLVQLLDHWAGERPRLTKQHAPKHLGGFFTKALVGPQRGRTGSTGLNYTDLLQFAAYCEGVHRGLSDKDFAQWMSYIRHLATHSIYDEISEVHKALRSIRAFPPIPTGGALQAIADTTVLSGFLQQQVREERLKAQLRLADPRWGALLDEAESHPYFSGQIEFLLDFSGVLEAWLQNQQRCNWPEEQHTALQAKLRDYLTRASVMFNGAGLTSPTPAVAKELLWERSLLVFGNYLLPSKEGNHGLLEASDRNASWKRLLRGGLNPNGTPDATANAKRATVKEVLDRLDVTKPESSLRAILDEAVSGALHGPDISKTWRRFLVEELSHLKLCEKRQVRLVGRNEPFDHILLMQRLRRSAAHWDLYARHLYLKLSTTLDLDAFEVKLTGDAVIPHAVNVQPAGSSDTLTFYPYRGVYWFYPKADFPTPHELQEGVDAEGHRYWKVPLQQVEAILAYSIRSAESGEE